MLKELVIGFRSPRSQADREQQYPSLSDRLVLPSLTDFCFKGDSEYLEEIVGRIDAPALDSVTITFFNQLVFDTPLLRDFFSRTAVFQEPHQAGVSVTTFAIKFMLFRLKGATKRRMLEVMISSSVVEWQVSSLAQFCSRSLPPLPTLEGLFICGDLYWGPTSSGGLESAPWSELVHSFVTVKHMYLSGRIILYVAPALLELTREGVPEVLPALRHVSVGRWFDPSGPTQEAIAQFVAARQVSGYPVTMRHAERNLR
jgi:hypothetical protein